MLGALTNLEQWSKAGIKPELHLHFIPGGSLGDFFSPDSTYCLLPPVHLNANMSFQKSYQALNTGKHSTIRIPRLQCFLAKMIQCPAQGLLVLCPQVSALNSSLPTCPWELAGDAACSMALPWSNRPCQEAEPIQLGINWTLSFLGASLAAQPGTLLTVISGRASGNLGSGNVQGTCKGSVPGTATVGTKTSPRGHRALRAQAQTHFIQV